MGDCNFIDSVFLSSEILTEIFSNFSVTSNTTESMLSENYLANASWPICLLLGIPVNAYCLYHLIKVTKLNSYIKAIMAIMVIHFMAGYIAIFCSLIPILFFDIQNYITCTILTTPLGYAGPSLQTMSGLTSVIRYYMAWMTSKNKIYQNNVIIIAVTVTVTFLYSVPIITDIFYDKYMVLTCMNRDLMNYHNPITVIVTFIMTLATLCGILADICMIKLLKKMKLAPQGDQLVPWVSWKDETQSFEQSVPRNSTLISTAILIIAGFWFAFCKTLAETLFLNTIVNIFMMPLIIKFTISSNLKTKIEIPKGLHFHENQMNGKTFVR